MLVAIKLFVMLLMADLTTYFLDVMMIAKNLRLFQSLRFIAFSISISLAVIIHAFFFAITYNEWKFDFNDKMNRWVVSSLIYIYLSYFMMITLNTIILFQVKAK